MTFIKAKKLKIGDKVRIKLNNEVVRVAKIDIYNEGKYANVFVRSREYGYIGFNHTDIS
jgi:cell envelope opacity-associated protein A